MKTRIGGNAARSAIGPNPLRKISRSSLLPFVSRAACPGHLLSPK